MSKKKENVQDENVTQNNALTIEEHKKNLNIDAPVFAAVMQIKGWGSGKKMPETVFKKAVEEFLGAPMDGVKNEIPAVEDQKDEDQKDGNLTNEDNQESLKEGE